MYKPKKQRSILYFSRTSIKIVTIFAISARLMGAVGPELRKSCASFREGTRYDLRTRRRFNGGRVGRAAVDVAEEIALGPFQWKVEGLRRVTMTSPRVAGRLSSRAVS